MAISHKFKLHKISPQPQKSCRHYHRQILPGFKKTKVFFKKPKPYRFLGFIGFWTLLGFSDFCTWTSSWEAVGWFSSLAKFLFRFTSAVARKPHDAAAVLYGLKFTDNIHYKFKSTIAKLQTHRWKQYLMQNGNSRSRVLKSVERR